MASTRRSARRQDTSDDAIAALKADHKKVKELFKQFGKLRDAEDSGAERTALVEQICNELTIHTAIEEEIFYPAVREQIDDQSLMDEALVEHAGAKELISQLQQMRPDDDLFNAKVTVLGEQINHHVEEEEGEMFPKARKAKVDTEALGAQMEQRKLALKAELGVADEETKVNNLRSRVRNQGGEKRTAR